MFTVSIVITHNILFCSFKEVLKGRTPYFTERQAAYFYQRLPASGIEPQPQGPPLMVSCMVIISKLRIDHFSILD